MVHCHLTTNNGWPRCKAGDNPGRCYFCHDRQSPSIFQESILMYVRRDHNGPWTLLTVMMGIMLLEPEVSGQGPPAPPPPKVGFVLKDRHGHATPARTDAAHTAGGNIDVSQPREDTLIITMTGVVTAGPHPCKASAAGMDFDLDQEIAIGFTDPKVKKAKL